MRSDKMKWREGRQLLEIENGKKMPMTFLYDWSKVLHIQGFEYIITGGLKNEPD